MATPPPTPPLSLDQTLELVRIAASGEPAYGSTLLTGPLSYRGLIRPAQRTGAPRWLITARGHRWLTQHDARRAERAARVRKVSAAQLRLLRAIEGNDGAINGMGSSATRSAAYERGLIDWVPMSDTVTGWTWILTGAGAALLRDDVARTTQ